MKIKLSGKESSLFDTEINHYHNASCVVFYVTESIQIHTIIGSNLDPLTVHIKLVLLAQSKPQRVDSKLQLCHKFQDQYHQENSFGRLCYLSAFQGECHF